MKYEVILEKGNYALIKSDSRMKEYAVVNGLNKESGDWSFSCGYYAYEYNGTPLANEAEMLSNALNEFREKTEEDYNPTRQLEIYREDYSERTFDEILQCLDLNDEEVGNAFSVYATVNRNTLNHINNTDTE